MGLPRVTSWLGLWIHGSTRGCIAKALLQAAAEVGFEGGDGEDAQEAVGVAALAV